MLTMMPGLCIYTTVILYGLTHVLKSSIQLSDCDSHHEKGGIRYEFRTDIQEKKTYFFCKHLALLIQDEDSYILPLQIRIHCCMSFRHCHTLVCRLLGISCHTLGSKVKRSILVLFIANKTRLSSLWTR